MSLFTNSCREPENVSRYFVDTSAVENARAQAATGSDRRSHAIRIVATRRGRMLFLEKTARLRCRVMKSKLRAPEAVTVSEFARHQLAFEPDARQAAVLDSQGKRGILNCTPPTGAWSASR